MKFAGVVVGALVLVGCGSDRPVADGSASVTSADPGTATDSIGLAVTTDVGSTPAVLANTTPVPAASVVESTIVDPTTMVSMTPTTDAALPQNADDALRSTLAGMPEGISATLGTTPPEVPYGLGTWLHVAVNVDDDSPSAQVEATWEAALLLGAVAERTAIDRHIASVVIGMDIDFVRADGTIGKGLQPTNPDIPTGQSFGPESDEATTRLGVIDLLHAYGLQPSSLEVIRPLGAALKVVAVLGSAEVLDGRLAELHSALLGIPPTFEGLFLSVELPTGEPIAAMSFAARTGQSSHWVRPDLSAALGGWVFSTSPEAPGSDP